MPEKVAINMQTLHWITPASPTDEKFLPDPSQDGVYIGINANGYYCCFTGWLRHGREIQCFYETAEETVRVMSGLVKWARIDPDSAHSTDDAETLRRIIAADKSAYRPAYGPNSRAAT